jgi:hypothetical protein
MVEKNTQIDNIELIEIRKRLDAIISLFCLWSNNMPKEDKNYLDQASIIKNLNQVGLSPTEIAHLLGKKSASAVAPYLYSKREPKNVKTDKA